MNAVVISDQFYNCKHQPQFQEAYNGTAEIYRWANAPALDVDSIDVLVVDLELGDQYVDRITEALNTFRTRSKLTGNNPEVSEIRERFERLEENVTRLLESGSVIIGLMAPEKSTRSVSSHDWIYRLQTATQIEHDAPREAFKTLPAADAVDQYFDHVHRYRHSLRLNEQTVTAPELLAAHRLDNELVGAALNEYRDRDGNHRTAPGRLVLLPQPSNIRENLISIVTALENVGRYYWERVDKEALLDARNRIDLSTVLRKGEAETIEFKRQVPPDGRKVAKEVVGLANRGGGVLVIGVADDRTVAGVEDIDAVEERVSDRLSSVVEPALNLDIHKREWEEENVLVVDVPAAGDLPRRLDGEYYVRIGTTCQTIDYPNLLV